MTDCGVASEVSTEPGIDRLRDKIAGRIQAAFDAPQPAAPSVPAPAADGLPGLPEPDIRAAPVGLEAWPIPTVGYWSAAAVSKIRDEAFELGRQQAVPQGMEAAACWVEARMQAYIDEQGSSDPDTGAVELPRYGDEYVGELMEITEGIRALAAAPQAPARPMIPHDSSRGQPTIEDARRVMHEHGGVLKALHEGKALQAPATGDVWIKHDDDLRYVRRVLDAGRDMTEEDRRAAIDIVIGLRETARASYSAPADERRPLRETKLADALVLYGIVDRDAIEDPEGFDDGETKAAIHRVFLAIKEQP